MANITIDGTEFDVILNHNIANVTTVPQSGFINSPIELQSNIWNIDAKELEYNIRLTSAEFYSLIQKFLNHTIVILYDSKKDISLNVWISNISERWEISSNKCWIVNIQFTVIT
jgi:hypothetical protein